MWLWWVVGGPWARDFCNCFSICLCLLRRSRLVWGCLCLRFFVEWRLPAIVDAFLGILCLRLGRVVIHSIPNRVMPHKALSSMVLLGVLMLVSLELQSVELLVALVLLVVLLLVSLVLHVVEVLLALVLLVLMTLVVLVMLTVEALVALVPLIVLMPVTLVLLTEDVLVA